MVVVGVGSEFTSCAGSRSSKSYAATSLLLFFCFGGEAASEFTGTSEFGESEFTGISDFVCRTCVSTEVLVFVVEGWSSDFVDLDGFVVDDLGFLVTVGEVGCCG